MSCQESSPLRETTSSEIWPVDWMEEGLYMDMDPHGRVRGGRWEVF
jgi:hypothetical protein